MTIDSAKLKFAFVFLFFCAVSAPQVVGQRAPSTRESIRVVRFNGDMAGLLEHLANEYHTPIGLELAANQQGVLVNVDARDVTFTQILDAITHSAPGYQWRERDSSIEVLPVAAASPFLDTIVRNFRIRDVDSAAAVNQLLNQPEIQNAIRAMGLKRRDPVIATAGKRADKISLTLEGITIRQALSRIAEESGAQFWIFRSSNNGSFSLSTSATPSE
jgi:hypothetical protein